MNEFNSWNESMNESLGLPDDEGTQTYSAYVTSAISDDVLGYFDDRCDTTGMTLIDYDQAVSMGFFPPTNV
jgi:hypothetical protein